jgi:GH25 family lysozyme M1 (1,4-beta-N-acetylmuramidase)
VYSYSKADSVAMAKKEAVQTLEIIKPYRKYITMPVYFDVEDRKNKGVEKVVSLAFCEVIEKGGYKAGIYSSGGWYRTYLKDVTEYTRWVAVYNGTFTPPTDIKNLDMWQFCLLLC